MNKIFDAIYRERLYQKRKWEDRPHEVGSFLLIMQQELQEAIQAWQKLPGDQASLLEILQVITVGVACLQQHGVIERSENRTGPSLLSEKGFNSPEVAEALFQDDLIVEIKIQLPELSKALEIISENLGNKNIFSLDFHEIYYSNESNIYRNSFRAMLYYGYANDPIIVAETIASTSELAIRQLAMQLLQQYSEDLPTN